MTPTESSLHNGYRVLAQGDGFVVVDKACGLLSVPGIGPEKADCLVARVAQRFPGARIVHRLDRDTSGVMVLVARAAQAGMPAAGTAWITPATAPTAAAPKC